MEKITKVVLPENHHPHDDHNHQHDHNNQHEHKELKEELPVDVDPNSTYLDMENQRMRTLTGVIHLRHLDNLCCRANEITSLSLLERDDAPLRTLETLDLYSNRLTSCAHLHLLINLTWLDLSFNELRRIENVEGLLKLREVFFANNKITKIENLSTLTNLAQIELGSNRIRTIENLDNLTNLEQLWLGRNKITVIQGLETLTNLATLSIQSNRLITVGKGLEKCVNLKEVYLSHNGLQDMKGFETLVNLKVLDLTSNQIKKLEKLENCTQLEEVWLGSNFIECFDDLDCIKSDVIETIYLERNPVESHPSYRERILGKLPKLLQIDANMVEDFIDELKVDSGPNRGVVEETERELQAKQDPDQLLDKLLAARKQKSEGLVRTALQQKEQGATEQKIDAENP